MRNVPLLALVRRDGHNISSYNHEGLLDGDGDVFPEENLW
jgi:hypothetical protein